MFQTQHGKTAMYLYCSVLFCTVALYYWIFLANNNNNNNNNNKKSLIKKKFFNKVISVDIIVRVSEYTQSAILKFTG